MYMMLLLRSTGFVNCEAAIEFVSCIQYYSATVECVDVGNVVQAYPRVRQCQCQKFSVGASSQRVWSR